MANLKIGSLNINGLITKDRQLFLRNFLNVNTFDVLCLQETHINNFMTAKSIEQVLNLTNKIAWGFGDGRCKGVAIIVLNPTINIDSFQTDIEGRLLYVDLSVHNVKLRVVNVYAPNIEIERNEFFENLNTYLVTSRHVILVGDFNCVLNTRLDKIGGNMDRGLVGSKILSQLLTKFSLFDAYRYLYPNEKCVTWFRKLGTDDNSYIGCRLDRFYITKLLQKNVVNCTNIPFTISDHDLILLELNMDDTLTFGNSYWKFNNSYLEDSEFIETFKYYWQIMSRTDEVTLEYWENMKMLIKEFCIDYGKSKRNEIYCEIKLFKNLYKISTDLKEKHDYKIQISKLESDLHKGFIVRSKTNVLNSNENPSSSFANIEQSKGFKKTISHINYNGVDCKSSESILTSFNDFYSKLYTCEPIDNSLNDVFLNNVPKVSNEDNDILSQDINKEEILLALKAMERNKSPGSDGLTVEFYLKFFDLFGNLLKCIYDKCFELGYMSPSQKLSYITLLCKDKNNSTDVKNYRPISLLNVDRKIVSKVLTNRLGNVLPSIISDSQTCSIKGRTIFDNVHLLRNIFDYCNQKDISACFINLDQEKAFDRVSWEYLYNVLQSFNFSPKFIDFIKVLYTDIESSIIVNNHISEPFPLSRSVRQGCSLSPLLYVLCLEPFILKVQNNINIKGIKVPGSPLEIKMSAYADDNTAILTDDVSISHFFKDVKLFELVSGSKVNYNKSNGVFMGKWKSRSDHPFGISWVKNCKVLGYYFGYDINYNEIWSNLFLKFTKVINLCRSFKMSFKGKSTVLNCLAFSKILYYISAGHFPDVYINMFQKLCFKFIWSSSFEPVNRKTLYLPFKEGGLNVPHVLYKWYSLLLSHVQKFISDYNAPWSYFTKYWIGFKLRKYNKNFESNLYPKSESMPLFYKNCLKAVDAILKIKEDISFMCINAKQFYCMLITVDDKVVKCKVNFPQINFSTSFSNIFSKAVDPSHRNICFTLVHDVSYVNYYLYLKGISKIKSCYFCKNIETVSHLFIECSFFNPLNKTVLYLLNISSDSKITLSEKMFRFFDFTPDSSGHNYTFLVILSISRFVIWNIRNQTKHNKKQFTIIDSLTMFLSLLRFRIYVDFKRFSYSQFVESWGLYDIFSPVENDIVFCEDSFVEFYVSKFKLR